MSGIGRFHGVTSAVFETEADPVVVSAHDIAELIAAARQAPMGRARLLLHPDREDTLHEMVIALPPDSCDHPHINSKSGKSFLALSGQFAVMVFSEDGADIRPIILSADSRWPGARLARLRRPAWHTIIPLAGDTVFLETIIGPFTGNQFAPWFPDIDRADERNVCSEKLRRLAIGASEGSVST
jgi:cupin fold WbuC family metalloprotein